MALCAPASTDCLATEQVSPTAVLGISVHEDHPSHHDREPGGFAVAASSRSATSDYQYTWYSDENLLNCVAGSPSASKAHSFIDRVEGSLAQSQVRQGFVTSDSDQQLLSACKPTCETHGTRSLPPRADSNLEGTSRQISSRYRLFSRMKRSKSDRSSDRKRYQKECDLEAIHRRMTCQGKHASTGNATPREVEQAFLALMNDACRFYRCVLLGKEMRRVMDEGTRASLDWIIGSPLLERYDRIKASSLNPAYQGPLDINYYFIRGLFEGFETYCREIKRPPPTLAANIRHIMQSCQTLYNTRNATKVNHADNGGLRAEPKESKLMAGLRSVISRVTRSSFSNRRTCEEADAKRMNQTSEENAVLKTYDRLPRLPSSPEMPNDTDSTATSPHCLPQHHGSPFATASPRDSDSFATAPSPTNIRLPSPCIETGLAAEDCSQTPRCTSAEGPIGQPREANTAEATTSWNHDDEELQSWKKRIDSFLPNVHAMAKRSSTRVRSSIAKAGRKLTGTSEHKRMHSMSSNLSSGKSNTALTPHAKAVPDPFAPTDRVSSKSLIHTRKGEAGPSDWASHSGQERMKKNQDRFAKALESIEAELRERRGTAIIDSVVHSEEYKQADYDLEQPGSVLSRLVDKRVNEEELAARTMFGDSIIDAVINARGPRYTPLDCIHERERQRDELTRKLESYQFVDQRRSSSTEAILGGMMGKGNGSRHYNTQTASPIESGGIVLDDGHSSNGCGAAPVDILFDGPPQQRILADARSHESPQSALGAWPRMSGMSTQPSAKACKRNIGRARKSSEALGVARFPNKSTLRDVQIHMQQHVEDDAKDPATTTSSPSPSPRLEAPYLSMPSPALNNADAKVVQWKLEHPVLGKEVTEDAVEMVRDVAVPVSQQNELFK